MEMLFSTQEKEYFNDSVKESHEDFVSELAKGHLWSEIDELEQRKTDFSVEYEQLNDKSSFKGQYLEVLIDNLESELKEKKKLYKKYK